MWCIFAAVVYMDEDDIGLYTIKTIDDPRTLNKTLNIRPPENILSQRELVEKWEKLIGKELQKISFSQEDFLASMKGFKKKKPRIFSKPLPYMPFSLLVQHYIYFPIHMQDWTLLAR